MSTYERIIATSIIKPYDAVYADVKPFAAEMMLDPHAQLSDLMAKYGAMAGSAQVYSNTVDPSSVRDWPTKGAGSWHAYMMASREIAGTDLAAMIDAADVWVVRATPANVGPPNVGPPNVTPPAQGDGASLSPMLILLVLAAVMLGGGKD